MLYNQHLIALGNLVLMNGRNDERSKAGRLNRWWRAAGILANAGSQNYIVLLNSNWLKFNTVA